MILYAYAGYILVVIVEILLEKDRFYIRRTTIIFNDCHMYVNKMKVFELNHIVASSDTFSVNINLSDGVKRLFLQDRPLVKPRCTQQITRLRSILTDYTVKCVFHASTKV